MITFALNWSWNWRLSALVSIWLIGVCKSFTGYQFDRIHLLPKKFLAHFNLECGATLASKLAISIRPKWSPSPILFSILVWSTQNKPNDILTNICLGFMVLPMIHIKETGVRFSFEKSHTSCWKVEGLILSTLPERVVSTINVKGKQLSLFALDSGVGGGAAVAAKPLTEIDEAAVCLSFEDRIFTISPAQVTFSTRGRE